MAEVSNKQVLLKNHVLGFVKESDMVITSSTMKLKLPDGSKGVLVKNLYLSCDPYMRPRMNSHNVGSYVEPFKPGLPITGYGVCKILESGDPNFKEGDLVWGITGWEEHSIISATHTLFKIHNADVPLSYYTGLLAFCTNGFSLIFFTASWHHFPRLSQLLDSLNSFPTVKLDRQNLHSRKLQVLPMTINHAFDDVFGRDARHCDGKPCLWTLEAHRLALASGC
ncbi:hypothetical protein F8388_022589 [Cannabis sativa]|uniref:Oxidoreductase N-terminal domain-containing protein n=1 Tax=Cannabis sativa TaxID=3483 RepID=A0A7J6FZE3_CANSA|nr:hypothetical protein F8388_022589 [Cannabis sativa]